MTDPRIEQKAREVAVATKILPSWHSQPCLGCEDIVAAIAAAIQSAVAEEREECAKIVETLHVIHGDHYASYGAPSSDAPELASAIRARGQKAEETR